VSQSERDALVVRGYLSEEERDNGGALKKAIEGVLSAAYIHPLIPQ
jgi:hypothetical protein